MTIHQISLVLHSDLHIHQKNFHLSKNNNLIQKNKNFIPPSVIVLLNAKLDVKK